MTDEPDHLSLLVGDIRRRMAQLDAVTAQPTMAKARPTADQRRARNAQVMVKALALQAEGRISAHDVARLQALRLHLESFDEG